MANKPKFKLDDKVVVDINCYSWGGKKGVIADVAATSTGTAYRLVNDFSWYNESELKLQEKERYIVVVAEDIPELQSQVNTAIKDGYEPVFSVYRDSDGTYFYQSMLRGNT
jgi:hypothetical protein